MVPLPPFFLFFFPPTQVSPAGVGKTLEGFSRDSCRCLSAIARERKAPSRDGVLTCLSAFLLRPGRKPLLSFARPLGSTLQKSAGRGERSCQGVNQRSPNIPKRGGGLEHALKTGGKRRRAPRLAAGLILVQARATSPRASPGRRALLRRGQRTSGTEKSSKGGPHRPAPHLGWEQPRTCVPFPRTAGSEEARAGWPAGERRGAPRVRRGAAGARRGTGPRPLASHFATPWGSRESRQVPGEGGEVLPKGRLCRNESRA